MESSIKEYCPMCDGSGTETFTDIGCCGYANKDGSCCGNGIPIQAETQCRMCEGQGSIIVNNIINTHYADITK